MKKFAYIAIVALAASMAACGGNKDSEKAEAVESAEIEAVTDTLVTCACDSCTCDSCTGNCPCDTTVVTEVAAEVQ